MDRSGWIPLEQATDAALFGHKAATLARLSGGGLSVLPGWVLATSTAPEGFPVLARSLTGLHPTPRWILRSSSPDEDRPGRSAAGWFHSESATASPGELERALRRVHASAADAEELLGAVPQIAILAQPHVEFDLWCTVEVGPGRALFEGWRRNDGQVESWSADGHVELDALVERAVQASGLQHALLEIGMRDGLAWVLQVRPAPERAPASSPPVAPRSVAHEGLGGAIHPGDDPAALVPDLEHCPTPLSVLLATTFGRWIASDAGHTRSRLVDGRWLDPPRGGMEPLSQKEAAAEFGAWEDAVAGPLQAALSEVLRLEAALDGSLESWRAFLGAWLGLQSVYFSMPGRGARRWAREQLAGGVDAAGLDDTPAAARRREWRQLQEELFSSTTPPARTAESIARWAREHAGHDAARELHATALRHRAVSPLPYDGFTPGLDADPWPLYRALAGRLDPPVTARNESLATRILALAERDNEALLEAYAAWRAGLRRIAQAKGLDPAGELHWLDIGSFEAWLGGAAFPSPAVSAGRALFSAWNRSSPEGPDTVGSLLPGRPAAGGIARGNVNPGTSLLQLDAGGIAVVDTLGPADAIAVPRFDAIVCAGGDVLGHASVLCREYGIPCVVGIARARERLRAAGAVLVDGDEGTVLVLD